MFVTALPSRVDEQAPTVTNSIHNQEQQMKFVLRIESDDAINYVCYVCELNDIFYVVNLKGCIKASRLENEGTSDCILQEYYDIQLTGTYSPAEFTASVQKKCLYLGNRSLRCIHCIHVRTENSREKVSGFIQWQNVNETPKSMSVTKDGRLVILVITEDAFSRTWDGRLEVYVHSETGGIRQMTVKLPQIAKNPWCVAYSNDNTFTFTYGLSKFGVMKVDSQGRIKAHCQANLSMPRSIKYAEGEEYIYVLDSGRHVLLQMNMELNSQRVLYDWGGGDDEKNDDSEMNPTRITFNESKTYAMVRMRNGLVDLYKINWSQ